ncbi:uncharacterized protein LOC128954415 [Oppia nitens]|uniref:uncharacterized protein LOC128954415 n=1 Tax=Oppia nitens TaxID=1686743 RepID=UPI0023DB988C|nr:uncharacterized protein LOC128954415 [Oppia nitens]
MHTKIFGQPFSESKLRWHASDVTRIQVLIEWGGIYLDKDVVVVQKLDRFRNYEMTVDYEVYDLFLGTQTLIAGREALFLRLWLQQYRRYEADCWMCNAAVRPTKEIINRWPELVHRTTPGAFGASIEELCPMLYLRYEPDWRHKYYAIHLLMRANSLTDINYCLDRRPDMMTAVIDEHYVRQLNTTFGEIARDLLDFDV